MNTMLFLQVYLPYCVYPAAWLCDPFASDLPYRLGQILSECWEAGLQSAARTIFTLAQVWLKVFFQHFNAKVGLTGYLMWDLHTVVIRSSFYYQCGQFSLIKSCSRKAWKNWAIIQGTHLTHSLTSVSNKIYLSKFNNLNHVHVPC